MLASCGERAEPRWRRAGAGLVAAGALAMFAALPVAPASAQLSPGGARAPQSFADIVERVRPAVVSIQVSSGGANVVANNQRRSPTPRRGGRAPFPDLAPDHPLNEFFKNLPRGGQGGPAPRERRRRA